MYRSVACQGADEGTGEGVGQDTAEGAAEVTVESAGDAPVKGRRRRYCKKGSTASSNIKIPIWEATARSQISPIAIDST